jgi:hypothetical protein
VEFILYLIVNAAANEYSSRFRKHLQSRSDIDTVAVNVVTINNYVSKINSYAERNSPFLVSFAVLFCNLPLDFNSAPHCIHCACKLNEQPITHRFDNAPAVFVDLGVNQIAPQIFQADESSLFVKPY